MKKYEYHYLHDLDLKWPFDIQQLNEMALDGWKVISILPHFNPTSNRVNVVMEREIITSEIK